MPDETRSLPSPTKELPVLHSEEGMAHVHERMSLLVGKVARASAQLEFTLRQLMVSLVDSKYAETVAAGLGANELVDMCTALVKINREVTEAQREECRTRLGGIKPLLARRNQLVHGFWAPMHVAEGEPLPEGALALVSKRRTAMAVVEISFEQAEQLADELSRTQSETFSWICRSLLAQLRREQVTEPPEGTGMTR
ncbi:hypothetical protein [Streptomyces atroolivaceus]|uniref:hypothetical protein n=1 Tax=Streptomyces atroolivaceus TaxID=66869 RepID=UPI00344AF6E0